jgi:type II secretory pathway component PulJ
MKASPSKASFRRPRTSFTLIEIMVAVAVMTLLIVLVVQLIEGGNTIILGSRKHLSADAQAREVFSRFNLDIHRMPFRSDIDVILSSNNNTLFFLSETIGSYSSSGSSKTADRSTLSLVGYRVNSQAQLERLGKGLNWTNSLFLSYSTNAPASNSTAISASTLTTAWSSVVGTAPSYDNGTDSDYRVFASGVFRFFFCFQKKDGTYSITLDQNALQGRFHGATAIILTLAVLDDESRKIVTDFSKLASALPTPTQSDLDNGKLPAQLWEDAVNDTVTFATAANIPQPTAARVRIYQRSFSLTQQ